MTFQVDDLRPVATKLFADLKAISFDGQGITRESFGRGENLAHEIVSKAAIAEGLGVEYDGVRNLVVTLPGGATDEPFIATGSHLDSVPHGGNYDGAAGVVCGFLAMIYLRRLQITPYRTVKLIVLRGEESAWFGKSWIGSRAMLGRLSAADLDLQRFDTGRSLKEYMEDIGIDVSAIVGGYRYFDPEAFHAFIEVHIEQGPVLEASGLPVGVVTGIYGNVRHMNVVCKGVAAHSGATPRSLRHDAVVATADFIMRVDHQWKKWLSQGHKLVVTHGMIGTNPEEHAISRVPGETKFSVEIRAENPETLDGFHDLVLAQGRLIGEERGVAFSFDDPIINLPVQLDSNWIDRIARLCDEAGVKQMLLPSGAGHDAAVFASAGIPTAMLFVRNSHGSHNPAEHMELDDFVTAIQVLARLLTYELPRDKKRHLCNESVTSR
jgi:N-carbamoyl-L-amino-acid hydrolase